MNSIAELKHRVFAEYTFFKDYWLRQSKENIFNAAYQIRFYTNVDDFIHYLDKDTFLEPEYVKCLLKDKGSVLACLWDYFLKCEYASVETYDDTRDLIKNYCEKYYKEDLKNGRI